MDRAYTKIRTSPDNITSQKLTKLYITALTTVAVLSILGQLLVQLTLENQLTDSRVVNLAGKQRYRNQEICIIYDYDHALYPDKPKCIKSLVTIWEKEHIGLGNGDHSLGLPGQNCEEITCLFKELNPHFYTIRDNALRIAHLAIREKKVDRELLENCTKAIIDRETVFLTTTNAIVLGDDQEALSNVGTIKVNVARRNNLLIIKDIGKGFDVKVSNDSQKDRTKSGNGISNMKERANLLNSTLEIVSWEDRGTQVSIIVPLAKSIKA